MIEYDCKIKYLNIDSPSKNYYGKEVFFWLASLIWKNNHLEYLSIRWGQLDDECFSILMRELVSN